MAAFSRRDALRLATAGFSTVSFSGWFPALARAAAEQGPRPRSCILLWMPGGPSQLDTFDPKPEHQNGGEFAAIETSVAGIRVCEHLPQLAKQMERLAIIRSMQTKEGDHGRATYHLRTGYRPAGPIQYPALGALVSQERGSNPSALPNYVSILSNPFVSPAAFGPGFLGPRHAPLLVGGAAPRGPGAEEPRYGAPLEVRNSRLPQSVDERRAQSRLELLQRTDEAFAAERPGLPTASHQAAYEQAVRMMDSPAMRAFRLEEEPDRLRDAYGTNRFGQACLLARRLVEQGVPFVEVALTDAVGNPAIWDTHQDNFASVRNLCGMLDPAWATLLSDLKQRGLLETTTVVWMGEFGRTPVINSMTGRDHFPNAWSTVLAGGGVRGGQTYGTTSDSGMEVTDRPVAVNAFLATLLTALGIDYEHQNLSNVGRPIRLVEPDVEPIRELLA